LVTVLVAVGSLAEVQPVRGQIVPPERSTTWNPGIPGGVPARTTICATINASAYGNGTQNAAGAIQNAINACPVGQVVQLSTGDFKITTALNINKGIVLRGQGPVLTKLKMPVGTNSDLITVGAVNYGFTQTVNLVTDAVKGTASVTLASNPGLQVGELVTVDQLQDPSISYYGASSPPGDPSRGWFTRMNRPTGQVMEIASVIGNIVTFTTPFHISFKTAFTAQLSRFLDQAAGTVAPATRYAGVEDLGLYGGSQGGGNIRFEAAAYSWIKNIESDYQEGASVAIDSSFRCVVRDSYIHSTQDPNPGGGGYGLSFSFYSADNLVENNIIWNMNKVMVTRASGGGNVIGYNYMDDGWISYASNFVEVGLNASHMTTPHYELFEGNQSFNFDGDSGWGNAVYITVFRNHLTSKRRSAPPLSLSDEGNRRAIGIMKGHYWYTFVGNVLGYAGMVPQPAGSSFRYENNHVPWNSDPVPMWQLGYNSEDWNADSDPTVLSTTIRDGNYDYVTDSVHWDRTPQTIPSSLYLTEKPAFFGSNPWPWVDPTGATKVATLPARARFDAMPPSSATAPLLPNSTRRP
jgi:hypothetical protein